MLRTDLIAPNYFIGCTDDYNEARTILFGAPYDGTVSFRSGSRFGPATMRNESWGLETYSPYWDKDLEDFTLHDAGDLELPFGNTIRALNLIEEFADGILEDDKKPFMLGGEHLVSLPVIKALSEKHPDLCIIHFDAHTDLRDEYIGEKLSHSSVMRRAWELTGDNRIFQFGIRSGTREEFTWAKTHTVMQKHNLKGIENIIPIIGNRPVYLSVDLDILDPSFMCGTGTTEAGGVSFIELSNALMSIAGLNIVGADLVELAPNYDTSGASTATACKIAREMMILLGR